MHKAEGSRGGHIIGRTRSGRPIYASEHHSYAAARQHHDEDGLGGDMHEGAVMIAHAHPDYTPDDHMEAADLHYQRARNGEGHRQHSHFMSQSHSWAGIAQRRAKKSVDTPASRYHKADLKDADEVDDDTNARLGIKAEPGYQAPPTFDPERNPNGTPSMPNGYYRRQAQVADDGLAELIIACAKAERSYQKPRAADFRRAATLRPARFLGE